MPRNTLQECIDHIVANADAAIANPEIPLKWDYGSSDLGRANKVGAMALKSRILLWAASDLARVNWYGSFEQPDLLTISGDRTAAWRAAQEAAMDVIELGYTLEQSTGDAFQDYTNLFVEKRSDENIFLADISLNQTVGILKITIPTHHYSMVLMAMQHGQVIRLFRHWLMTMKWRMVLLLIGTIQRIKLLHMKIEIHDFTHPFFMMELLGDSDLRVQQVLSLRIR